MAMQLLLPMHEHVFLQSSRVNKLEAEKSEGEQARVGLVQQKETQVKVSCTLFPSIF